MIDPAERELYRIEFWFEDLLSASTETWWVLICIGIHYLSWSEEVIDKRFKRGIHSTWILVERHLYVGVALKLRETVV